MSKRHPWLGAAVFFLTTSVFWLPSIALHARAGQFSLPGVSQVTLLCPALALVLFVALLPLLVDGPYLRSMLACRDGIWFWGPPSMLLPTLAAGGETGPGWRGQLLAWAVFPLATFDAATYDGTLVGLLGISLVLTVIIAAAAWRRFHDVGLDLMFAASAERYG